MTDQEVIQFLENYGYYSETAPDLSHKEIQKLDLKSAATVDALAKYQGFDRNVDLESVRHHGEHVNPDGVFGPATEAAMKLPRCGYPDFNPPGEMMVVGEATGRGNWRGCHGIGDFHSAVCEMNLSGISQEWQDVWEDVMRLTQKINAQLGLLWRFVDTNGKDLLNGEDLRDLHVDTKCTFVRSAPGWIGLAIVGKNIQCNSQPIWLRLLTTYGRQYERLQRVWQLTSLLAHELTHNEGWSHDGRSLIQAPSIGTHTREPSWIGDSMENDKRQAYGGVPVPVPGGPGGGPDPDPEPEPSELEQRVLDLERQQFQDNLTNAYQTALLDWYRMRLDSLEGK